MVQNLSPLTGHLQVVELLLRAEASALLEAAIKIDGFTPLMAVSCAKHRVGVGNERRMLDTSVT